MKQFKKEFLTQHLLVLCAMSIIGALVRNEAMQYGVDTFSCNLTFVISTTILMVVYLHALDSIVRLLAPWFKHIFCNTVNNTERKHLSSIAINDTNTYDEGEELNLEDVTFVYADEASSCITSYEQLRQKALEDKAKKEKVLLNSAIDYTRRTFAAYMKEEHLNQLCDNIAIFQCCASTHMGHHSLIVDKAIRTIALLRVRSVLLLYSFVELGGNENHSVVLDSLGILPFLWLEVALYSEECSLDQAVE